MSPADDKVYVANPEYAPELLDFQRWGLKVINPDSPDPGFPYWENLSWENCDKYQPDLILWDDRAFTPTVNEEWGDKQPTWFSVRCASPRIGGLSARGHGAGLAARTRRRDERGQVTHHARIGVLIPHDASSVRDRSALASNIPESIRLAAGVLTRGRMRPPSARR